jgi:hypothetical protein
LDQTGIEKMYPQQAATIKEDEEETKENEENKKLL